MFPDDARSSFRVHPRRCWRAELRESRFGSGPARDHWPAVRRSRRESIVLSGRLPVLLPQAASHQRPSEPGRIPILREPVARDRPKWPSASLPHPRGTGACGRARRTRCRQVPHPSTSGAPVAENRPRGLQIESPIRSRSSRCRPRSAVRPWHAGTSREAVLPGRRSNTATRSFGRQRLMASRIVVSVCPPGARRNRAGW